MAAVVADLGECGKSPLAKGEWPGDLGLSLAYQRICGVLQTTPGGLALEQASSEVLAGMMLRMGPPSRRRWSCRRPEGPRRSSRRRPFA